MVRVYAANLHKYTCGNTSGQWLTLPMAETELKRAVDLILGSNEELILLDYDAPIRISEYQDIFELNRLIIKMEQANIDLKLVNAIVQWMGEKLEDVIDGLIDGEFDYYSHVNDLEDVAEEILAESGCWLGVEIPEQIREYLSREAMANHLETSDGWYYDSATRYAFRKI